MTSERAVDGWEELRRLAEAARDVAPNTFPIHFPVEVSLTPQEAALLNAVTPDVVLHLIAAARGEPPEPAGTETRCPLGGVHEHVFRGPHRFREWEPGT